ncbi:S41 family peptidase [Flavobacterium sp. JP2137]|uniref:S41 family peptidase n=1 Tax=Flavobacterium sp. JP2137 TaxID=3414510 RepID=UPI003D2FAF35
MRFKLILLLALIGTASWAQTKPENKTATLIKVWGFLKYHHPQVATGLLDWDGEFMDKLQRIEQSSSSQQQMQVYLDWLSQLQTPKPCHSCSAILPTAYPGNAQIDWSTTELTTEVQNQLNLIFQNRNTEKNYYVQFHQYTQLPLFNNERQIADQSLPNAAQRLLALARYWNAVRYFYPYQQLLAQNWEAVLLEAIPTMESATTALEYQLGLVKINKQLDNSSAFVASEVLFEKIGQKKVPFKIEKVREKWLVAQSENDSLARLSALQLGDELLEIDGVPIAELAAEKGGWISSSNPQSLQLSIAATLLNGAETVVKLRVRRGNETLSIEQERFVIRDYYWDDYAQQREYPWLSIDEKTLWLSARDLEVEQLTALHRAAVGKRNLIVDLRDYQIPAGFKLAEYLVPRAKTYAQMIEPKIDLPGNFNVVARKTEIPAIKRYFTGLIYVLVDEKTRGQAELMAMLLKGSDRVTLVGSTTSGTVGYPTKLVLPGAVSVFFTGIGVQNPDGTEVQQLGLQPDVAVDLGESWTSEKQAANQILEAIPKPQ